MAFYSQNNTVRTTPTEIVTLPPGVGKGRAIQIFNADTAAIFIGTSTVTTSGATRGRSLAANGQYQIWIDGGDTVYAISAAGTAAGAVTVQYSA
jgi:hypothetical protein